MVGDWWRSFSEGEDALMVAKRNAEVGRLNALAREVMRSEGRLGEVEIEVGEGRFAVGDQVITRVNDHRAGIYNRERWRVEAIDAEGRGVELQGVDTDRRVTVGADYLGRQNPSDGAPALQHAYAATTYQAQGSTVDRAYVMADPSMDRQELYVAASRSREETFFYATPEVDLEREEFAPHSAGREGLAHIAAAAERDGAQVSAHDQALRSRLDGLSSPELVRLRDELRSEAGAEAQAERRRDGLDERIAHSEELIAGVEAERRALGEEPRWGRARQEHRQAAAAARHPRGDVAGGARTPRGRARGAADRRPRCPRRGGGDRPDPRPARGHGARRRACLSRCLPRRRAGGEAGRRARADRLGPGGSRDRGIPTTAWAFGQRHCNRAGGEGPGERREQIAVERSIATAQGELGIGRERGPERTPAMEIGL